MPIGEGGELSEAVGRHEMRSRRCAEAGVHIALAGHFHRTYAEAARKMVNNAGGALVIQAGTATSTRLRNNELQSFNWIQAHRNNDLELQVIAWDGERFGGGSHARYTRDGEGWSRLDAAAAGDPFPLTPPKRYRADRRDTGEVPDMDFDDQLRRYFGTTDLPSLSREALAAGVERMQVDLGLEKDRGRRFALWALMHMLGAAPDLDVAFKDEADRNAARNFMELAEKPDGP